MQIQLPIVQTLESEASSLWYSFTLTESGRAGQGLVARPLVLGSSDTNIDRAVRIALVSASGEELYASSSTTADPNAVLDLNRLAAGNYFVKVTALDADGQPTSVEVTSAESKQRPRDISLSPSRFDSRYRRPVEERRDVLMGGKGNDRLRGERQKIGSSEAMITTCCWADLIARPPI